MNSETNPKLSSPDEAHEAEARAQLERELEAGETLRWCSRANVEALVQRAREATSFGTGFLVAAIVWTVLSGLFAMSVGGWAFFWPAWGLVLCGFAVWIRRAPSRARLEAASTFYGVTDRRAIVIEGTLKRSVRSWRPGEPTSSPNTRKRNLNPATLTSIKQTQSPDGTGDVLFAEVGTVGKSGSVHWATIGFYGVRDPGHVASLLREIAP